MSSIEEQLTRDIAAATENLVVTDVELRRARADLDQRIVRQRSRSRRRVVGSLAVAAVVLPVLGYLAFHLPGSEKDSVQPAGTVSPREAADNMWLTGDAPTQDQLQGVWRLDNDRVHVRFWAPDRVALDDAGGVVGNPAVRGTYTLEGDLVTVRIDGGWAGCDGQTFSMRTSVPEDGLLRLAGGVPYTGRCSFRSVDYWALERLLPAGIYRHLGFPQHRHLPSLTRRSDLFGAWVADGGRHVLEMDPGGAYYVVDAASSVVDQGSWALSGSALTLTSSAASATCEGGDRLELVDLRRADRWASMFGASVRENTCGGDWTETSWAHVPDKFDDW